MCHIEKHLEKSIDELAIRMIEERKEAIGTLFNNALPIIDIFVRGLQCNFVGKKNFYVYCNEYIGLLIDRYFDLYYAKTINVVVENLDGNIQLLTAYPIQDQNSQYKEKYDINKIPTLFNKTFKMFGQFSNLVTRGIMCMLDSKRDCIHIITPNYKIRVKGYNVTIHKNNKIVCEFLYQKNLIDLINKVNTYKDEYTLFGHQTLEDWIFDRNGVKFAV